MGNVERRLLDMGVELRTLPKVDHTLVRTKAAGDLLFVSGHGTNVIGKVGDTVTVEEAYAAARDAAINCLSAIREAVGDLDRVTNVVKVFGGVNSAPDFTAQPAVVNGASDLIVAAFGPEIGLHARSAMGMASLPRGIAVEIEMIVQVRP